MCGILGGNNCSWEYKKAVKLMQHRGPDSSKIDQVDDITIAFTRLSILDLSSRAMQPMYSPDGLVSIVYNGEIYGYTNMKNKLIESGYHFKTTCDSEVVLFAYLEYGEKFIEYIDGMFAIAIYDKRDRKIRLYRDRVGIKPLYYFWDGKNFAFSSELKGICQLCNNINFNIDYSSVYDYLTYQYIPQPKTLYVNVYKMAPASMVIYDIANQEVKVDYYWALNINSLEKKAVSKEREQELFFLCREKIKRSVKEQLVADVPTGVFLSGGIDSSIIAYEVKQIDNSIESYSMDFTHRRYSEKKYIDSAAKSIRIVNSIYRMKDSEIEKYYYDIIDWFDEPFADIGAYPSWLLAKKTSQKVKVVLSGDGGDEVFGGYPRHFLRFNKKSCILADIYENYGAPKRFLRQILDKYFTDDILEIAETLSCMRKYEKKDFASEWGIKRDYDDFWFLKKYYRKDLPSITRIQYLDFMTYLPESVLTKLDRVCMRQSLESRVPFLSKDIIEFSFGLAQNERIFENENKWLLKQTYKHKLPYEILYRPKHGFSPPFEKNVQKPQLALFEKIWKDRI